MNNYINNINENIDENINENKNTLNKIGSFVDNVIVRINSILVLILLIFLTYLVFRTSLNIISINGVTNQLKSSIYSFEKLMNSFNSRIKEIF